MLQKILGGHPEIHTLAEPWVMLYPCFGLKNRGCLAYYEAGGWAQRAMRVFLECTGGEDAYYRAVREMGRVLYRRALDGSGKAYFLDKTPRYYWIMDELAAAFPRARFVVLLRNPLAVLCSVLRSWVNNPWCDLDPFQADLLRAPGYLCKGIERLGERVLVVCYEELLEAPAKRIADLMTELGLSFEPGMLNYESSKPMTFGDALGVMRHDGPDVSHAAGWLSDLRRPAVWRMAYDYLEFLREKTCLYPCYDYGLLKKQLLSHCPSGATRLCPPLQAYFKAGAVIRRVRDCLSLQSYG